MKNDSTAGQHPPATVIEDASHDTEITLLRERVAALEAERADLVRTSVQRCRSLVAKRSPLVSPESALDSLLAEIEQDPGTAIALDNCELCGGANGGVPGNEQVVDGLLMCDHCHAARHGIDHNSRIYQICEFYERGVDHGQKHSGIVVELIQHADPEFAQAYQIGVIKSRTASQLYTPEDAELLENLKLMSAVALQVASFYNAPNRFLDAFSDAAGGMIIGNPLDLLPLTAEEAEPLIPPMPRAGSFCCIRCQRLSLQSVDDEQSPCVFCDIEESGRVAQSLVEMANELRAVVLGWRAGEMGHDDFFLRAAQILRLTREEYDRVAKPEQPAE